MPFGNIIWKIGVTLQVYNKYQYQYQRFGKACCLNPGDCLRRALGIPWLWRQLASAKRWYLWTTNQHGVIYLQCEPRIQLVESRVGTWSSDGHSCDDCFLGRTRRFEEHCCWLWWHQNRLESRYTSATYGDVAFHKPGNLQINLLLSGMFAETFVLRLSLSSVGCSVRNWRVYRRVTRLM